jgi:hypothetical protein
MASTVQSAADVAADELSFDSTVDRQLVHVRGLSEIFVTDHRRLDDDAFVTGVQVPRSHQVWCDRRVPVHDPVITLEIGRQTVFLVVHHHLGVPQGWKFVLNQIDFHVLDLDAYRDDRRVPPEGVAYVRLQHRRDRHGVFEAGFAGDVCIRGTPAMTMSAEITALSPYNYKLMRAYGRGSKPLEDAPPPPPACPAPVATVGRSDPRNVVVHEDVEEDVETGRLRFRLVIDEGHPGFFDHPHDHVTGSLILEFYRQAAIVAVSRSEALASDTLVVTGCSMTFREFAELDAETECIARVVEASLDAATVELELRQAGARIAWASLELTVIDPSGEVAL